MVFAGTNQRNRAPRTLPALGELHHAGLDDRDDLKRMSGRQGSDLFDPTPGVLPTSWAHEVAQIGDVLGASCSVRAGVMPYPSARRAMSACDDQSAENAVIPSTQA